MRMAYPGVSWMMDFRRNYFVARIGAGVYSGACAGSISWNFGSARRPGGLASLVQQHEAVTRAKAAAAKVVRMRIMMTRWWFLDVVRS